MIKVGALLHFGKILPDERCWPDAVCGVRIEIMGDLPGVLALHCAAPVSAFKLDKAAAAVAQAFPFPVCNWGDRDAGTSARVAGSL